MENIIHVMGKSLVATIVYFQGMDFLGLPRPRAAGALTTAALSKLAGIDFLGLPPFFFTEDSVTVGALFGSPTILIFLLREKMDLGVANNLPFGFLEISLSLEVEEESELDDTSP